MLRCKAKLPPVHLQQPLLAQGRDALRQISPTWLRGRVLGGLLFAIGVQLDAIGGHDPPEVIDRTNRLLVVADAERFELADFLEYRFSSLDRQRLERLGEVGVADRNAVVGDAHD